MNELPSNQACYPYFPGGRDDLNSVICPQMLGMATGVFDIIGVELTAMFTNIEPIRLGAFLRECVDRQKNGFGHL